MENSGETSAKLFERFRKWNDLPVWRQSQSSECGLVCLSMIARYWNGDVDLLEMRARFPVSARGWTLQNLMRNAESIGLKARALRIDINDVKQLRLPAVIHWDLKHFVVLAKLGRRKLVIHDPRGGRRTINWHEMSQSFTGVALELWPSDDFKFQRITSKRSWTEVIARPTGLPTLVLKLLAFGTALQLIGVLTPLLSQWGIDSITTTGDLDLLVVVLGGMTLLAGFGALISVTRSWLVANLTSEFILRWKADVFTHLISLPISYFHSRRTGDIVSRFDSIERIVGILNDSFAESLLNGLFGLTTLFVMLLYSPSLTALAFVGAVAYVLLRVLRARHMRDLTRTNMSADARENTNLIETIRGIRTLKLFSSENFRIQSWLSAAIDEANSNLALARTHIAFRGVASIIGAIEQVVIFGYSVYLVTQQQMTLGMMVAFFSYRQQFYSSVISLVDNILDLYVVKIHAERIADVVFSEPEDLKTTGERLGELENSIRLEGVSFSFSPTEPTVLDQISLYIETGESVAITGPSGCGKSTLVSLLCGFLPPSQGRILMGGVNCVSLGLSKMRADIAAVMQDEVLFSGTIASNIAAFDPSIDINHVISCARIASIHEDILRMPMGYNTLVGDIGSSLSGGERQRICIARALYRRPRVLLLDEATSHLDLRREVAVNEGIKGLGITRVIIAHRLETLCSADRLIFMNRGKITAEMAKPLDRELVAARLLEHEQV